MQYFKNLMTLVFGLILLFSISTQAQSQRTCGTNDLLQELIAKNPQVAIDYEKMRTETRNFNSRQKSAANSIVIPVVVHVFHNTADANPGQNTNISDAQIFSQIEVLNNDYNALNADLSKVPPVFQNLIGSLDVEFRMAEFDELGNATNGITRHPITAGTWSDNLKPGSIWDQSQYLNIWVTTIQGGVLGYATFPGTSPNGDGVVVDYRFYGKAPHNPFASDFNMGRTTTHEIGHWLGLEHTFEGNSCGGASPATCKIAGDGICDTPPVSGANYGCNNSFSQNTCSETPIDNPDMWMNYMDYMDDACLFMFTKEQADVMLAVLNSSRVGVKTSGGVTAGPTYSYTGRVVDIATGNPVPYAKVVLGSTGARYEITCDNNGQFSTGAYKSGNYKVYAGQWGYMTRLYDENLNLSSNTSGIEIPIVPNIYYDDFIMDFGWTVSGSAVSGMWERGYPIGTEYDGKPSNPGADVDFDFDGLCYITGNDGGAAGNDDVDDGTTILTSPVFDISNYDRPYLSYYRWFFNDGGKGGAPDDALTIKITNGITTTTLETINTTSNNWGTFQVDLSTVLNKSSDMQLIVETSDLASSGHIVEAGFDLFTVLDSTNLPTGISNVFAHKKQLKIYPNPSNGQFIIDWQKETPRFAAVRIFNLKGQTVWQNYFGSISNNKLEINSGILSGGLYILEVFDGEKTEQHKLSVY